MDHVKEDEDMRKTTVVTPLITLRHFGSDKWKQNLSDEQEDLEGLIR